jgi:hypothetical protein
LLFVTKNKKKGIAVPNIEIHGFDCPISEAAIKAIQRIREIFTGVSFYSEIAVEIVLSSSQDLSGNHLPYLRVWDTNKVRGRQMSNTLRMNGFCVERPVALEEFGQPSMWSEGEIHADLSLMLSHDWMSEGTSQILLGRAIEDMRNREFGKVAQLYIAVAHSFLISLGNHLLPPEDMIRKVDLHLLERSMGEAKIKMRLVQVMQIIESLVPKWKWKNYFIEHE